MSAIVCAYRPERSRPASEPGGQECNQCGCIFIGAEWHAVCAVCLDPDTTARDHVEGKDNE
jgi:hypothetical protein